MSELSNTILRDWAAHNGWEKGIDSMTPRQWLAWHFMNRPPGLGCAADPDWFPRLAGEAWSGTVGRLPELEPLVGMTCVQAEIYFENI